MTEYTARVKAPKPFKFLFAGDTEYTHLVFHGGRAGGKSYTIAMYSGNSRRTAPSVYPLRP